MKLDLRALGIATGLILGLALFAATMRNVLWARGGDHLNLLSGFIPGYSTSVGGAFAGLVGLFVLGFIGAWVLGWVYNKLAR
jgi:hypothetical protein